MVGPGCLSLGAAANHSATLRHHCLHLTFCKGGTGAYSEGQQET